jgi:hypothetical protein
MVSVIMLNVVAPFGGLSNQTTLYVATISRTKNV